jgi:predicted HicB family RNase H-like nuclease
MGVSQMSTTQKYRDYIGSVEVSVEDNVLHGKILHIRDMVTYEADSPKELQAAFEEAVDEYLADCIELGKAPNKPFSGTFNVRVGEALHRESVIKAAECGINLNEFVARALRDKVGNIERQEARPPLAQLRR